MNVMACHHWGKLVADIGVTFKEDLLVGPIEIAEFVAGDVDIQSSWRVIVVWTLKFYLCYSRLPVQGVFIQNTKNLIWPQQKIT